jgi:hypothetical protein
VTVVPPALPAPLDDATLAEQYLSDRICDALLEIGEAAKASEITLEIGNDRITFPMVRRVLTHDSARFVSVDRLWNLHARYLDRGRPTERNLQEVLRAAGRPLSTAQLATELSAIYDRPGDVYFPLVGKLGSANRDYFKTASGEVAPRTWLPLTDADEEDDVLFDNDLTRAHVAPFEEAASAVSWSLATYAEATRRIVEAAGGQPVSHKVLGVLAWRALRDGYDPLKHFIACYADTNLVWLSGGRWITRGRADGLENLLAERAAQMGGARDEAAAALEDAAALAAAPQAVPSTAAATDGAIPDAPQQTEKQQPAAAAAPAEAGATPVAEPAAPAARKPLDVSAGDLAALEQLVTGRETAIDVAELLSLQYEVVPGDPSYKDDVETLFDVLRRDDRFPVRGREPVP